MKQSLQYFCYAKHNWRYTKICTPVSGLMLEWRVANIWDLSFQNFALWLSHHLQNRSGLAIERVFLSYNMILQSWFAQYVEVIKANLQLGAFNKIIPDSRSLHQKEGLAGFYRGLTPGILAYPALKWFHWEGASSRRVSVGPRIFT